jgi:hypothetical protein
MAYTKISVFGKIDNYYKYKISIRESIAKDENNVKKMEFELLDQKQKLKYIDCILLHEFIKKSGTTMSDDEKILNEIKKRLDKVKPSIVDARNVVVLKFKLEYDIMSFDFVFRFKSTYVLNEFEIKECNEYLIKQQNLEMTESCEKMISEKLQYENKIRVLESKIQLLEKKMKN